MDLQKNIFRLTEYGIRKNLIEEADRTYIINQFLMAFDEKEFSVSGEEAQEMKKEEIVLAQLLDALTDEAVSRGMIEGGITERDLFDTKLMGILTARPSEIIAKFQKKYEENPVEATDYFYAFSQDTNYIRRDRIQKDRSWKADSPYGEIDITINLSKPEKDPKAIAAAKNAAKSSYPACQLCVENEGYAGRLDHPARQNLRIIPLEIQGSQWGFQYSPYVYYNEHCIVFNGKHVPMKI